MSIHDHWDYKFCTHLSQNAKQGTLSTSIGPTHQHIHPRFHLKVWHNTETAAATHMTILALTQPLPSFEVTPTHPLTSKFSSLTRTSPFGVTRGTCSNLGRKKHQRKFNCRKKTPNWETPLPVIPYTCSFPAQVSVKVRADICSVTAPLPCTTRVDSAEGFTTGLCTSDCVDSR